LIVDTVLANTKAYLAGEIVDCNIAIDSGKIFKIGKEANMPQYDKKMDLEGFLTLPGLIDVHVHLRDEGKIRKEDFLSGTSAAAAGGITTVLDMPNNDPVTMSSQALRNRMETAESKVLVNVGFYSEYPSTFDEIENIVNAGAVAFKLFMTKQIGGLDIEKDAALEKAFRIVGKLKRLTATHAEDSELLNHAKNELHRAGHDDIDAYLKAHSEKVEVTAIGRLLRIAEQTNMHIHFCHVTTKLGLDIIANSKRNGIPATCETTPHNLLLTAKELKRIGTLALTMPPVRDKQNIEALWDGIHNGSIDMIASDHAPHMLKEKESEDVWDAKVGFPGLETTIPLLLTEVRKGRLSIRDIVKLMAEKPAEVFGLKNKGSIKTGNCADLTVIDLRRKGKIDSSEFHSMAKFSPFDGWSFEGIPVKTIVNGQLVMDASEIVSDPGTGKVLRR
jgi:dihydroorotase (multifunctional complex type)